MIKYALYSGKSSVGYSLDKAAVNEDFIVFSEFDNTMLFSCIADGAGQKDVTFTPAAMVSNQTCKVLQRLYKKDKDLFRDNTRLFIEEAMKSANNILIGYKLGDEAKHYGLASTLTCATLDQNGVLTVGHVGNTRLYIVRNGKVLQVTKDQTEAQKMVEKGQLNQNDYYSAIERFNLYCGMGISPEPDVQTFQLQLDKNDVVVMTTDGIHYSYKPEAIFDIFTKSETVEEATENIINTAIELHNYADNSSVNVIWYIGEGIEDD